MALVWSTQRLQTNPRTPSATTLQQSRDGQLLLVGDHDLYIFTPDPDLAAQPERPAKREYTVDAATSIWTVIAQADRAEEEDGGPSGGANQLEDDEIKKSAPTDNARPVELKLARIAVPERLISWERSESYDFRVLNAGQRVVCLEVTWKAACWSPSTLSSLGGCLVAGLTSTGEVFIFEPERDPLTGVWSSIDNITEKLLATTQFPHRELATEEPVQEQLDWEVRRVYDAQTTSLAWSSQALSLTSGPSMGDLSLLALGLKGGLITLWQWSRTEGMVCVGRGRVEDRWITHLAWSDWQPAKDDSVQAALAYSTPTGVVKVLVVKQLASGLVEVDEPQTVAESDERPLTTLSWLGPGLLSWTKPGEVFVRHVQALPSSSGTRNGKGKASEEPTSGAASWHGSGRWRLKRFGSWADSSRLATCSGIGWYGPRSISFSLSDGSHHIIGMPEESSDLAGAVYDLPLSRYLTTQARELFLTTERPMELVYHPLEQAGVRIAGCCRLDGYWAWLQQPTWNHDLSSFQPSKRHATLLLAEIPVTTGTINSQTLDRISRALDDRTTNYLAVSPLVSLLPALLPFYVPQDRSPLPLLSQQVFEALIPPLPLDMPHATTSTERPKGSDAAKAWFRAGLREDLWGATATGGRQAGGLQKRLAMADFFAERNGPLREHFVQLQEELFRLVVVESAVIILAWVAKVQDLVQHVDDRRLLTILIHVALTSLLRPSPQAPYRYTGAELATITGHIFDLSVALSLDLYVNLEVLEGAMTSVKLVSDEPATGEDEAGLDKPWDVVAVGETCPACTAAIHFEDVEGARCANGHEWDRCSLTFAVMSSAQSRRCLHCARPTMLQPSSRFNRRPLATRHPPPAPPAESTGETHATMEVDAMAEPAPPSADRDKTEAATGASVEGPASPASTVADVDMVAADDSDDEDIHVTLHVDHGPSAAAAAAAAVKEEDDDDIKPDVKAHGGAAEPWLMAELLEAATCCLYCGGRFALAL